MAEGKTKAPSVDGKRLASLEASVSSLAIALTANGIVLEEGADPTVTAIVTIKQLVEQADAAAASTDALIEQLAVERSRVAALEAENKELQQDVEDLASAKNGLANKLAGEGGAPDAEQPIEPEIAPEPEAPARERPEASRDVGPTFGGISFAELGDAIRAEAAFEIAFSNGEFEIIDFPPVAISPSDLHRVDGSRYVVAKAIDIMGGVAPERIHGAGLLLEGVQVGYCALEPAAVVLPGHEWRFHRSLIF